MRNGVAERARKIAVEAAARRKKWLRLAAFGFLSMGASIAIGYHVAGRVGAVNPNAAWHGKIAIVARAPGVAPDAKGGITLTTAKGTSTAAEGSEVGEGTEIQTDSRTRARIAFDDGTSIAIDRGTRVRIESGPRTMKLEDGQIIADVAHLEGASPAKIATPNGDVAVLGTKLALTSEVDRTSVEVLRGSVELKDNGGTVQIGAGEEGIAARGAELTVAPVNDLAQRVAFGERLGLSGVHNEDTDLPVSGLGELRARRPGKTDEKDHALAIAHHGAKIRIAGNVARTEIDETFTNDTNDDLEGIYRFPLPPGAQIERLALEEKGQLIDGSFVDTQRGEAIFRGAIHNATPDQPKPKEEIIWVPGPWRDPALLEWQRGGRFELRIFPIPKHGSRRVVLAYTETVQPVAGLRRYTYPLPDAAALTIGSFDADVQVIGQDPKSAVKVRGYELAKASSEGKAERFTMSAQSFVPSGDLTVEYALDDRSTDVTAWGFADDRSKNATPIFSPAAVKMGVSTPLSSKNFVALAFRPKLSGWTDAQPHDVVIAVDSGRSMFGERFQRARRLAVQIAQEMDRRDRVAVLACDTTCRAMQGGLVAAGSSSAHDADSFLAGIEPDGASDLVGAVRAASSLSSVRDVSRRLRVILLSDGIASAGYRTGDRIEQEVHDTLSVAHDEAVAVPIGADADTSTLSEIARGGGGVVVPYAPGEMLETAALDVLNATYGVTLRDVELTLPAGLTDSAPAQIAPIRAGGELIVAARMAGSEVDGDAVLRGKVAGEPFEARYPLHVVASSDLGNAFVPRLYASARIADEERGQVTPAARADVVDLSQRFHVASKFTSLLVLESEAMFRAFGINRDDAASPLWTGESEASSTDVATLAPDEEKTADTTRELAKDEDSAGSGADLSGTLDGVMAGASGHGAGTGGGGGGKAPAEHGGVHFHAPPPRPSMIAPKAPAGDTDTHDNRRGSEDRKKESTNITTTPATPPPAPPQAAPTATTAPQQNAQAPLDHMDPYAAANKSLQANGVGAGSIGEFGGFAGGQWMKRVWTRVAAISASNGPAVSDEKIAAARAALVAAPDERARYVDLVHLLSAAGATEELGEVLAKWSSRDPLDEAATTARADLAARAGDRDRALRIVDGVAAGINAPTSKVSLLEALALAHERAGDKAGSCAFRVAVADVRAEAVGQKPLAGSDVERVAHAVACERSDAREASAQRWLEGRAEREQILALAGRFDPATRSTTENTGFGDVIADATWDPAANVDIDLAIVDPAGNRLSWMGKSSNVRVAQPTNRRRETLAVTNFSSGAFTIEIVRGAGGTAPVNGTLTVRSLGQTMTVPFLLTGVRASVARVDVHTESHLVPVSGTTNEFDQSTATTLVKNVPLAQCSIPNGPNGAGRATILFDASGRVSNVVVSTPFSGTSVASCIIARLSRVHVAPFAGSATVARAFVIPP
ncbi:MAG: FecR domain-containing protein [Polyangiaceae bacterium]